MDIGASSYRRFLDGDDEAFVEIIKHYKDGLIDYNKIRHFSAGYIFKSLCVKNNNPQRSQVFRGIIVGNYREILRKK